MNQPPAAEAAETAAAHNAMTAPVAPLFADTTRLYLLIVLAAALGAYLYMMREQSIFSCTAKGYSSDEYLAYCHADHYGDFDHGAFWFGLEPGIRDSARDASVLFLGSSRMQFGFSSDSTQKWFTARSTPYYLMGFAYWENYLFEGELVRQIKPHARVYVINLDTFFENTETVPAKIVMHDEDALSRYQFKQTLQHVHARVCAAVPFACGHDQAFFRSRSTGAYVLVGGRIVNFPTTDNQIVDAAIVRDYTARAKTFIASLPVESRCVLLTMVPTVDTPIATARAIAQSLGTTLIAPQVDGLTTFDKSHMDRPSAERWSKAFFEAAGPQITQCLAGS